MTTNVKMDDPFDAGKPLSMKQLFDYAVDVKASDLLITSHSPPVVRVNGSLYAAADIVLDPESTRRLIWSLLTEIQQEQFERTKELDVLLSVTSTVRFRANIYYQRGSVAGAFRLIPDIFPSLHSLGLHPIVHELALRQQGLILVTGPAGSGKSTTTAAMIDLINETRNCHIVTIEDPIEFVHRNKCAIIDQREVYADTLSFANALKYVLRETPDVILVGELRDLETIAAALTAAETGTLVIATLHANDAIQSIDRMVDVFPPQQQSQVRVQIAFCLLGVLAQHLILRADKKGRVLAMEVLLNNTAIASHIREGKTHLSKTVVETSRKEGMITMDARVRELYLEGRILFADAVRYVSHPRILSDAVHVC